MRYSKGIGSGLKKYELDDLRNELRKMKGGGNYYNAEFAIDGEVIWARHRRLGERVAFDRQTLKPVRGDWRDTPADKRMELVESLDVGNPNDVDILLDMYDELDGRTKEHKAVAGKLEAFLA